MYMRRAGCLERMKQALCELTPEQWRAMCAHSCKEDVMRQLGLTKQESHGLDVHEMNELIGAHVTVLLTGINCCELD